MVWTCGLDPMNGTLYPKMGHACEKGATIMYNWGSDLDTDQVLKFVTNLFTPDHHTAAGYSKWDQKWGCLLLL